MKHGEEANTENGEAHFLDNVEVEEIFAAVPELLNESDRGAVLICSNYVDELLKRCFERIAPPGFSRKELKSLLRYPGTLSTFSGKVQIALVCGLIPLDLGGSINQLRDLRNKVAHSGEAFRLRDNWDLIRAIFDLGPGVPTGINRMALEVLFKDAVGQILKLDKPLGEEGEKMFSSPAEVIDYIKENPKVVAPLEDRVPRMELVIGTAMIAGLIVHHRDRWAAKTDLQKES
ncbi:MAG: hypothetical protein AB4040_14635 [Synechococcus sp.]